MQVSLLTADHTLELGDARLGPSQFVRASGDGWAGVLGRRLGQRRKRRRRSPPRLASPLAIEPGRAISSIGLAPIIDQLRRNPSLARKPRNRLPGLKPQQKPNLQLSGKETWR